MAAIRKALLGLGLFAALLIVGSARASYLVTVDTSNLSGPGALAFDLIDGGLLVPSSTVTISSFNPVGALWIGTATLNGFPAPDLSSTVTFTDTDPSGFNEYLQPITLGSQLSFILDVTSLSGDVDDSLSFFIIDPTGALLVITDVGGALLTWDAGVTDPAQPNLFQGATIPGNETDPALPVSITKNPVPEPGALALVSAALLALGLARFAEKGRVGMRLAG